MPPALKAPLLAARKRPRAFSPNLLRRNPPTLLPTRRWRSSLRSCRGRLLATSFGVIPRLRHVGAFTLLELLVVMGIIAILMVLAAPAFTALKSAGDVTSAAYTIKGALEQARTYAKANDTYTWVSFAGSLGANTTPPISGQIFIAIAASKDGTDLGTSTNITGTVDITQSVTQIGKVQKLDNAHIGDTGVPNPDGSEFESRPTVSAAYRVSSSGDSDYYFIFQQTKFIRWIRFSPRGEAVVKGSDTQMSQYAEVGLLPTHGALLAVKLDPATGKYKGNLAAIQITGVGGNVRVYRR
jgi:prepilin-type N-terminal cleavage/methylation domain-containing protein